VATAKLALVSPRLGSPTDYLGLQRQDTTIVQPVGWHEVPRDAPPEPVYFTVRAGDRGIAGITYRSVRRPDRVMLWLDTDGDGRLAGERSYVGTRLAYITHAATYRFGPIAIRRNADRPGGDWFYAHCSGGRWLTFHPAYYREGSVAIEGRSYRISLVDRDFDGRFDTVFEPPAASRREPGCDVLAIDLDGDARYGYGKPGASEVMPLSRMVRLGEQYYALDVAPDGCEVSFRSADPQFGWLDLNGRDVLLGLWSDAGPRRVVGMIHKLPLPAGRYSAVDLELTETETDGRWTFAMGRGGAGALRDFAIRPGETTAFEIGPPFQARTTLERYGERPEAIVGFELEGRAGEHYSGVVKHNGRDVSEPSVKIVDASGRVVTSGRFAYS
jgi:hypothetical protein